MWEKSEKYRKVVGEKKILVVPSLTTVTVHSGSRRLCSIWTHLVCDESLFFCSQSPHWLGPQAPLPFSFVLLLSSLLSRSSLFLPIFCRSSLPGVSLLSHPLSPVLSFLLSLPRAREREIQREKEKRTTLRDREKSGMMLSLQK